MRPWGRQRAQRWASESVQASARHRAARAGADGRARARVNGSTMKQLVDFLPVIVFVLAYVVADIFVATAALMIAATLQIVIFKIAGWHIGRQMWVVFFVAVGSGGLTLVFQARAQGPPHERVVQRAQRRRGGRADSHVRIRQIAAQ